MPNPLDDSPENSDTTVNDYNIKFTIGDEICSGLVPEKIFCNAPLAINTRYGLVARIFTRTGFRDTEPIFIENEVHPLELMSPMVIAYGSVGSVALISLMVLICCFQSGKNKRRLLKEKKEAAEADENLLSFTSYCVIDKHPLPRKNYDE